MSVVIREPEHRALIDLLDVSRVQSAMHEPVGPSLNRPECDKRGTCTCTCFYAGERIGDDTTGCKGSSVRHCQQCGAGCHMTCGRPS